MSYTAKDLSPLVRGDDWSIKLTITENSAPVVITGYTYWLTLKTDIDSSDPGQLQISTVATSPNSASGIVYLNVPHASTNITPQTYNYDVQQVDTSSPTIIKTILLGKVKVVKDVTRTS
jgi:hypothetical protein